LLWGLLGFEDMMRIDKDSFQDSSLVKKKIQC